MANKTFVCPTCGFEEKEPGLCPDCGMDLEEMCPRCGNSISECVCEVDVEEAKEK